MQGYFKDSFGKKKSSPTQTLYQKNQQRQKFIVDLN